MSSFFGKYFLHLLLERWAESVLSFLKKPLFQKRRRSYDFPPRKTAVAQKHRAISRQEKMALLSSRSGCLGRLPSPGKGWAMKRAVRSSSDVWCGEGLARALFPRFRCVWWPAKFTFQQTGNLIFFLYFSASRALWLKRFSTVLAHSLKCLCLRGH